MQVDQPNYLKRYPLEISRSTLRCLSKYSWLLLYDNSSPLDTEVSFKKIEFICGIKDHRPLRFKRGK